MINQDFSLKAYNTFGIECIARQFIELKNRENVSTLVSHLSQQQQKTLVIGEGSNILFQNPVFDGIAIVNRLKGIELVKEDEKSVWLEVSGGEIWDDFAAFCVENNYYGIENLSLIPGTVGAAPVQNIGAYGVEVKDVIEEVSAIKLTTGESETFNNKGCQFSYRNSIFKQEFPDIYLIVSVLFKLSKKPKFVLDYGKLKEVLSPNPSLQEVRNKIIEIREAKLPDPKLIGNAGSFFKNPIISIGQLTNLLKNYPKIVHYPAGEEKAKLAAGWLIDQAGWKGKRKGDVGVHQNQALVIVNYGDTSGQEIIDFSQEIMDDIFEKFGVILEREVRVY